MKNKDNNIAVLHTPTPPEVAVLHVGQQLERADRDENTPQPIDWEMSSFDALRVNYIESHCSNIRN